MREEMFIGEILENYLRGIGYDSVLAGREITGKWRRIVGEKLFEKSIPVSFEKNRLEVVTPAPAWSSEIHMMSESIIRRIAEETGIKVNEIKVKTDKNVENRWK